MDIALLGARIAGIALGALDGANPRRQRAEDRVEHRDDVLLAADHHAEATIKPPHAAGCADIDIVDAFFLQHLGAANVVFVERISAIDNDIALLERCAKRFHRFFGRRPGRQHDPRDARFFQLLGDIFQRLGALALVLHQRGHGVGAAIVADHAMPLGDQAAGNPGAHPSQSDHCDLHVVSLVQRSFDGFAQCFQSVFHVFEIDPQRAAALFVQHRDVADGLRQLHGTEIDFAAGDGQFLGTIRGQGQEHAGVGAAFIGLPRRVQEARPNSTQVATFLASRTQRRGRFQ